MLEFNAIEKMKKETSKLEAISTQVPAYKGQISVSEAGQRGGKATLRNQGPDFFKNIGKRGGKRTAKLYGHLMRERGKRGGRPRRPRFNKGLGEMHRE